MVVGFIILVLMVNWVMYVYDWGVENYVFMEFICGVIYCGMNYVLYVVSVFFDIL